MPLDDAIFWIAITVFGAGLYVVFEHHTWGIVFIVVGLAGLLYSLRGHFLQGASGAFKREANYQSIPYWGFFEGVTLIVMIVGLLFFGLQAAPPVPDAPTALRGVIAPGGIQPSQATRSIQTEPCVPVVPPVVEAGGQKAPGRSSTGPYHYRNEMTVEETMKTVRGLSNLFKDARSLTFVITGHPDNESFRTDFYSLIVAACQSAEIAGNSPCSIENAPDPQREVDVDIPTPQYPGIVIHHEPILPGDQTGLDSLYILGIGRFVVRKSSHVPEVIANLNRNHQPHFYWFELGPGCPWNDPDICGR